MHNTQPGLFTDKYELTMADAALKSGVARKKAVFEVFARKLPEGRRYGVVAGTQRLIDYLPEFLDGLSELEFLTPEAKSYLEEKKREGYNVKVTGYREGELYFPNSPILTVEGEFGLAVLIETLALSILNHDCAVASAASRMVYAAKGRAVSELGGRRTQEDAAVAAARAAYITGFSGTSNLAAAKLYDVPAFGTSAHAFTLAHETEKEAFAAQISSLGVKTTLLVDTYDIAQGIRNAVEIAGPELGAIRIDSGDLHDETVKARELLDSLGATETKIVVSSDLDEYAIDELLDTNSPIDSFGAGTRVVTGSGHPTASMVYKLVAIEDDNGGMRPVAKNSSGKKSVGGFKQAWRVLENGIVSQELLHVRHGDESTAITKTNTNEVAFRSLQVVYYLNGAVFHKPSIKEMRAHHQIALNELSDENKRIVSGKAVFEAEYDHENH